jgi:hypothetical protein
MACSATLRAVTPDTAFRPIQYLASHVKVTRTLDRHKITLALKVLNGFNNQISEMVPPERLEV